MLLPLNSCIPVRNHYFPETIACPSSDHNSGRPSEFTNRFAHANAFAILTTSQFRTFESGITRENPCENNKRHRSRQLLLHVRTLPFIPGFVRDYSPLIPPSTHFFTHPRMFRIMTRDHVKWIDPFSILATRIMIHWLRSNWRGSWAIFG